ncbi:GNAT family N-acetyltransferase [Leifsonia poae]|uniref:GNAT family N-acetyltransferase n=1 Tax=Leifsonia poae TaxID=110933 RepID=UPI001CBF158F|nr:GNAT family N-acetyltransferase [Leifsonia poae]
MTATLLVHVVPALRRRGIGSALLAKGEDLVADGGRTVISAYTEHPAAALRAAAAHDRGRVHAPIGRDGLPAGSPEVAFALRHGYRLGQVERSSELALPLAAERRGRLVADARAQSADYRTITWWRTVPDDLIADFAALKARMTVDVPQSGIELDTETWTTARVREHENELIARGEPLLVTAAQHLPSGTLVGYTEIAVPEDGDKAEQYDTLVAPAHRGHRLGTLLKLENLDRLAEVAPHIRRLLTWNAAENTPMLAVNDAFGFRQHGLTGTWQKSLP